MAFTMRVVSGRPGAIIAVIGGLILGACAAAAPLDPAREGRGLPAVGLQVRWRVPIHEHGLFEPRPEECASGVLAGNNLVLGSRGKKAVAVDRATGVIRWSTALSGGVDAEAVLDSVRGQVYLGTDDGIFVALDAASGGVRWSFKGKGEIARPPAIGEALVYVATAADRLYALDARTGQMRWQYDRDPPDGFSVHGHAGPRLAGGLIYSGFTDGTLVALRAETGEVWWSRALGGAAREFIDVDSTPVLWKNLVVASSYSGGLYALDAADGEVRWHLPVEGAGSPVVAGGRLFFAAPREGLSSVLAATGDVVWHQGLASAGDITAPLATGGRLIFSGSRAGVFVVDRSNGALLQTFNPGDGVCAAPTVDEQTHTLFVLANSGTLYALGLGED